MAEQSGLATSSSPNPQSPPSENAESKASNADIDTLNQSLSPNFQQVKNLVQNGYCVLPQVLNAEECNDAIDKIWNFFEDTSNGLVQRSNCASWAEHAPSEGYFNSFGAGWLLGSTREILAERVFQPLYSTDKLHSSKEGFRLLLETKNEITGSEISKSRNPGIELSPLIFRAAIILNSASDEDDSTVQCKLSCLECSSVIDLAKGDVILFRSDFQLEELDDSSNQLEKKVTNIPAVMYCTMKPAIELQEHKKLWIKKVESYKERRIGGFEVDNEERANTSTMNGRCYFRSSPPLLSKRLSQLYGLLPYESEDWKLEMERAVIKGVRFLEEEEYESLPPNVGKECQALSSQLTSSDHNILFGQDKYLGGMASPCGRYVYGVPGTARRVMRIHVKSGEMDCIGPNFSGKFKWLRGVEIPASVISDENYPDGCCIALSCNHLSFLKVNPANDKVYTFGNDILEAECEGVNGWYYHGGNLASNGWIYCIPANAKRVVKLNPLTDEVIAIGPAFEGGQKWYGGLIGSDGCIYGVPHNAQGVLKIDPRNDEVSVVEGTDGPLPSGNWKWHGGLVAGDKIIGFPNNSDQVLVIDCKKSIVYTVGDSSILRSGRHRIPQDGRYKYLGGALTGDGRFAYFFPCDAERVMRMDCATDELSLVGPCLLDGENKFQNGFSASDGCLYGIPQRAVGVIRIIPDGKDGKDDHVDVIPCGEDMMSVKDKFEGGVLGHDGCIYCIPLKAKACVKITPEQ